MIANPQAAIDVVRELSVRRGAAQRLAEAKYEEQTELERQAREARYAREHALNEANEKDEELRRVLLALASKGQQPVVVEPKLAYEYWKVLTPFAIASVRTLRTTGTAFNVRATLSVHHLRGTDAEVLYEPRQGTSDEVKIDQREREAKAACLEAIKAWTPDAVLLRLGIDPATAPDVGDLFGVQIKATRRSSHWQGETSSWYEPSWQAVLFASGEPITGLKIESEYELAELRADKAAGGRYSSTSDAKQALREQDPALPPSASEDEVLEWASERRKEAHELLVWLINPPRGA